MKVSARELVLLIVTLGVGLFGVTGMLAGKQIDAWKTVRREQAEQRAERAEDLRLLESRDIWEQKFAELRAFLPQYAADKQMDAHWLSVMDNLAQKHGVSITKRQVGEEQRVGDIYEMPIEVRDWSASLDAIVRFLYDLQSQGAMLDVRQLLMKPNEQKELRGRFVLYCAYTRASANAPAESPVTASPPVPAPPPAGGETAPAAAP